MHPKVLRMKDYLFIHFINALVHDFVLQLWLKCKSRWTQIDTGCTVRGFSRIFATLMDTLPCVAPSCRGVMVHWWSANLGEAGMLRPLLQQPQDMRCWSDFYNQFTRAGGINPVHSLRPPFLLLSLTLSLSLTSSPSLCPLLIVGWIIQ